MQKKKLVSLFFLIIFFNGCDLFNTRDPEQPVQPRSNYKSAVTPEILLENFTNSLSEKNVQNYLNCFSDSSFSGKEYQFIPSAGSSSKYPVLLNGWSKKSEEQFLNNLISHIGKDLPITFTKNNESSSFSGDNSIAYSASYFLVVPRIDGIPKNYEGDLQFYLIRDSREIWSIYLWRDIESSQHDSWSELKGFYSPN
ncbi:MAG: hypothetical protein M0Q21_06435 [Ignavibacteriaceae bacterium]|nr:hypothetical protein [Ignavibacteriaceae bacterium]